MKLPVLLRVFSDDELETEDEPVRVPPAMEMRPVPWSAWDALAVGMLAIGTWSTRAADFWGHRWLALSYGDWAGHAYRAKFLATWGLSTWDPDWGGGLPLFQGYQLFPHVITAATAGAAGVTQAKAMMLLTALLLVGVPVVAYIFIRLSGVGRAGGLLGSLLLVDSADIFRPVADYTHLFGLVLVPFAFWCVTRALGRRAGYLGAVGLGLLPFFHPFAAVAASAVLLVRAFHDRGRFINRVTLVQVAIAISVASFYWLPDAVSARPRFLEAYYTSTAFEQHLFPIRGLGGWALAQLLLSGCALALVRPPHRRVAMFGLVPAALLSGTAILANLGLLPAALMGTQPARWIPISTALAAIGTAPLGDRGWTWAMGLKRPGTRALATVAMGAAAVAVTVEGVYWYRVSGLHAVDSAPVAGLTDWATSNGSATNPPVVWAPTNDVPLLSYLAFQRVHFTQNYVPQTGKWSPTASALEWLIESGDPGTASQTGSFDVLEAYLRASGARYVLLGDGQPGAVALTSGSLRGRVRALERRDQTTVAEVPWVPRGAVVVPMKPLRSTALPDLRYTTDTENRQRDRLVQDYSNLVYGPTAVPVPMSWRNPETAVLSAPAAPGTALVFPQNWDTAWVATAQGRRLPLERGGPNYVVVDLTGLSGTVQVELRHEMYPSWIVAWLLTAAAVVFAAVRARLGTPALRVPERG